jgi:hypothetical protein
MTYERNKEELLKEAGTFGLAFMGDGATIHQMPLMNILAMSGTTSPVTVGIIDCTTHMAEGVKKDAALCGVFPIKCQFFKWSKNHFWVIKPTLIGPNMISCKFGSI